MKLDLNIRKRKLIFFLAPAIFLFMVLTSATPPSNTISKAHVTPPQDYQIKTIVIDAGHGGRDSGAKGSRSLEKNIALEVALKLGKEIERQLPGVRVMFTRRTDEFIDLYKRIRMANAAKADIFISIHCNSAPGRSSRGTETIVSGSHRLGEQTAAIRENASLLLEENYKENYQGFDPKDPESYIIFSLMKNQYREKSVKLANLMQQEYVKSGRISRGILEQGLAVLAEAGMPAVLTEIGFVNNRAEEDYMLSDEGQSEIVQNLVSAISAFKKSVER